MAFASFMASATGRTLRVIVGLVLLIWGIYLATAGNNVVVGIILAVVGLVPLIAGLANVCLFAPLFGGPFSGSKIHAPATR